MTPHAPFKTYLDVINACNQTPTNPHLLYKFLLSGHGDTVFGHLLEHIVLSIHWREDHWQVDHSARTVRLLGSSEEERSLRLRETLLEEKAKGTFRFLTAWTDETWPVFGGSSSSSGSSRRGGNSGREIVLRIERSAAPLFGVVAYGVQLLAYSCHSPLSLTTLGQASRLPRPTTMWIARRSRTKRMFPGMLDCTVGGSLTAGELPFECLVREAEEEAQFPETLTRSAAVAVGTVSFMFITDDRCGGETGLLTPEIDFVYDMRLQEKDGAAVIPHPGDGEVEEFIPMKIEEVKCSLLNGEFMPAVGVVVLDFFVRHGILTYENAPDYLAIAASLRAPSFGVGIWES